MKSFDFSRRYIGSIEFAGTICAGKMTLLEALKRELMKSNSSVEVIAEDLTVQSKAVAAVAHYERQILLVSLVTTELMRSRDRLVLVHRGLYDAIAFMRAYVRAGLAEENRAFAQINAWRIEAGRLINAVIYVKTPARVAYKRAKRKFSTLFGMKIDPIFNVKFFEILEDCYSELEKEIPFQKLIVVNGELSPEKNIKTVLEWLSGFFYENGKKVIADSPIVMRMVEYVS